MGERERRVGDMLGSRPGDMEGSAQRKAALYTARADAARAARLAGYKSPLRRLIEHLLRRRHEET
jgi:hypothetical protein